jgi:spoIIIJ-associated protein
MKTKGDQNTINQAVSFLQSIFKKKDLLIQISPTLSKKGELILNLKGQTKPLKRQPQVVSALTKLVQLVIGAHTSKRYTCVLDLEGHLEARSTLIDILSADVADVTNHTQKRAVIEGLSSFERRKIHKTLDRDERVNTQSEGEGEFRYLMVVPKVNHS